MSFKNHQRGMGLLYFMVLIALVSFFMTLLLKLGPAYMNFWTIRSVMDSLVNPVEPIQKNPRAITDYIIRNLDINGITNIAAKDFVIKRAGDDVLTVTLKYEHRKHLFFNADAVLTFENQVELSVQ